MEGLLSKGVFGVQFNDGAPGFLSPFDGLEPVRAFLDKKGHLAD